MSKQIDKKPPIKAILEQLRRGSKIPVTPSVPTPKKLGESTSSVQKTDEMKTHLSGRELSQSPVNNNTDQTDLRLFLSKGRSLLHQSSQALDFFNSLHISTKTLSGLWIGLDPNDSHQKTLIFPCSESSWYSGVIGDKNTLGQLQFHGQGMCVFGMKAAYKKPRKTVFVTRTLIDCLSVMETGNLSVFADEDHTDELIECLNNNPQIPSHEAYRHCMTVLLGEIEGQFGRSIGQSLRHVFISKIPAKYGSLSKFLIEDRERFETFLNAHRSEHRDEN